MSYDVALRDADGNPVQVERHEEGGTILVGGNTDAEMSVTYNYSKFFGVVLPEGRIESLHGMTGADSIPILRAAISILTTRRDADYWAATPGNAGYALFVMEDWAEQHPDAVWDIH